MFRNITSLTLTTCLFILFSTHLSFAQCTVQSVAVTGLSTSQIFGLGQSFKATCGTGSFSSITFLNSGGSASDVVLEIYEGDGYIGMPRYSKMNLGWGGLDVTVTIDLTSGGSGNLNYTSGLTYTFKIYDSSEPAPFVLVRSTTNPYPDGLLYDVNGNAINSGSDDLDFMVQTTGSILPVELTAFDARIQAQKTLLTWATASELNNAGWDIERSADGQRWETLAFVNGNGTTTEPADYQYIDLQPLAGTNYYRLRQMDYNGDSDYSTVRVVNFGGTGGGVVVSPNPVQAGDVLTVAGLDENAGAIMLVDIHGRPIWESTQLENGPLKISLPNDLPKGMYSLAVFSEGKKTVKRVAVQ